MGLFEQIFEDTLHPMFFYAIRSVKEARGHSQEFPFNPIDSGLEENPVLLLRPIAPPPPTTTPRYTFEGAV